MKQNNLLKFLIALIAIFAMLLATDICLRSNHKQTSREPSPHLVIPVEFIYKYPDCANKLIEAANLTNIRIVSPGTSNMIWANRTILTAKT